MSDPVAILLDDAMPPERLGDLLRAARKRRGWSRKHAAAKAGTTPERLRAYEQGRKSIPPELCTKLAACYGDDLLAHVPVRNPVLVHDDTLSAGGAQEPADASDPDDVIAAYARLVRRVRHAKPGQPVDLRASDMTAIAAALGFESDELERRIATALGCTREEARALHRELLRRRVVLPVAGLAAGVAAFGGVAYGAGSDAAPATKPTPAPVVHISHAIASRFTPSPTSTPTTALAHPHATTVVPVPKPAPEPIPDAAIVHTDPTTTTTLAPTPAPPHVDPAAGTPVSILPGETPITIEGPPDP